jgi:exonuclease III
MIITSYNVRGLGGLVKRRKIRELIKKQNIQFLAIQETKLEAISDKLCYSLWGSNDCDWSFRPS